jgi:hypothetical protein
LRMCLIPHALDEHRNPRYGRINAQKNAFANSSALRRQAVRPEKHRFLTCRNRPLTAP